MTDFMDDALQHLSIAYDSSQPHEVACGNAAAQVLATLHLAEQQRIANLIAFVAEWNAGQRRGENPDGAGRADVQKAIDQTFEGLGLS